MRRTQLKAMSDQRRAEFAAAGITNPTSTFKPKPKVATAKRPKDTGPDKATVELVLARDGHRCVACGVPLHGQRGVDYSLHHRKRRSQGVDNSPANLVSLCGHGCSQCHGLVHSEVAEARLTGFLLRSTENPEEVPVEHARHGRVLLLNDGSVAALPLEANA